MGAAASGLSRAASQSGQEESQYGYSWSSEAMNTKD